MRTLALVAVATVVLGQSALAGTARDALTAVAGCATVQDTAERLKCYDTAAQSAKAVLDEAARQEAARRQEESSEGGVLAWFGFAPEEKPVTKPEDFGIAPKVEDRPDAPKEITEISAKVLEYAKNAHGKSLFILENGQIWRQLDGDTTEIFYRTSDGPMTVRIEKAFMGSFALYVDGKNVKVKVRRLK